MSFIDIARMTGETLAMTFFSTLFAYLLGLPCGVLLNVTSKNGLKPCKWLNTIVGTVVNILRSIPCLIIIVICFPWSRAWFPDTGWYRILIPMTICAFGFVARMVEQSLAEVPAGEIEAVRSLGATDFQLIIKVLLPEAKVSLVTGAAVVAVNIIGYTSFAKEIGAGGLIQEILTLYGRDSNGFMSSWLFWMLTIIVVLITQLVQKAGLIIAKKIDKRRLLK